MCEIVVQVHCPHCASSKIRRNGKKPNGSQNFFCHDCSKQFLSSYAYRGADPKIKQLALSMTLHGSGIRDIASVLGLYPSCVVEKLFRHASKMPEPRFCGVFEDVEVDEFWSFVGKRKEQKRWVWYAYAPEKRKILAFHIGKRNKSACRALFEKLGSEQIGQFSADEFRAYAQVIPAEKHQIGKAHTTHIERLNRDFRTHLKRLARKTVCHSKSDQMHYQIIKMYINHRNAA